MAFIHRGIIYLVILSFLIFPILSFFFNRYVNAPLANIRNAFAELEKGNDDYRITAVTNLSEFSDTYDSFNRMAEKLKELLLETIQKEQQRQQLTYVSTSSTNATDAADYLVNHGVPFRDAHGIVGRLVLYCIDRNKALDDMTLEEFKAVSPVFEEDIYDAISLKTCVEKRLTLGAPGPDVMKQVIEKYEEYLLND